MRVGNSKQAHLECEARGVSGEILSSAPQNHRPSGLEGTLGVIQFWFSLGAGSPQCPPSLTAAPLAPARIFLGLPVLAPFVRKSFLRSAVVMFPPHLTHVGFPQNKVCISYGTALSGLAGSEPVSSVTTVGTVCRHPAGHTGKAELTITGEPELDMDDHPSVW